MQKGAKIASDNFPVFLIERKFVIVFLSRILSFPITEFKSKSSQFLFEMGIWESMIFIKLRKLW